MTPFTVVMCSRCSAESYDLLLPMLRSAVRRCPHGMLVVAECVLGQPTCATCPSRDGVMLAVQPCTHDRAPAGPAMLVGPVSDTFDALMVTDWVSRGGWET